MLKSVVICVFVVLGCILGGYVFFKEHDRYDPVATGAGNNPSDAQLQAEEISTLRQRAYSRSRAVLFPEQSYLHPRCLEAI